MVGSCTVSEPSSLELLARHARHDRCVGVRDITTSKHLDADEAAPVLADIAGGAGWSFEARRHHDGFDVLDEIAVRWPELWSVMSHGCLPLERTDSERRAWTTAASRLARRPNVVCKISAVAGASDPGWTVASIRPWILGCIETFGRIAACSAPTGPWTVCSAPLSLLLGEDAEPSLLDDEEGARRISLPEDDGSLREGHGLEFVQEVAEGGGGELGEGSVEAEEVVEAPVPHRTSSSSGSAGGSGGERRSRPVETQEPTSLEARTVAVRVASGSRRPASPKLSPGRRTLRETSPPPAPSFTTRAFPEASTKRRRPSPPRGR